VSGASRRFLAGLAGTSLTDEERRLYASLPPFGFLLFRWNLESAEQAAELIGELRSLANPAPLLYVDQEGGSVDRIGPVLGLRFPSAATCAAKGTDRVHENAYLMGRAARLLGFDVDLAPVVDLAQPGTGAVVLAGRSFGFHAEDVVVSALVFLHGLARAGVASCLKHFPGLGRGPVDSHDRLPVVDAHDVDLMVTDVAPFTRLARNSDGVMVGHAAYPGFTGDETPASLSPRIYQILRGPVGYDGVVYSDDLRMGALEGSQPERAARAAAAGCDVLCLCRASGAEYEDAVVRVTELEADVSLSSRLDVLRARCAAAPRPAFSREAWEALHDDVARFLELLEKPREKRPDAEPPTD
jgi:beta-N-acetylhexosaminidase